MKKREEYGANDITVLEGLDAVRKRPGMYIGSTSERGLHHLVYEVVDNSVDEALAGYCDVINVRILPDNIIEISDNGRGIPVEKNSKHNKSALEIVMTVLHAGGKFENKGYKISGGLHGVGVSVVNALSTWLEAEIKRDGKVHYQKYNLGVPEEEIKIIGDAENTGTTVRFKAEPTIFETVDFSFETISKRCKELAYLNKGLRILVSDERDYENILKNDFYFEGGIVDFVKDITRDQENLIEPIYMKSESKDASIEVAIVYNNRQKESIFSFVNNINTHEGGTHVSGFKSSLTRVFNDAAKELGYFKNSKDGFVGSDVREGIVAIVSVKIPEPQFEGQTKTKLGNSKVSGIVSAMMLEKLKDYFLDKPKVPKVLVDRMLLSKKAREAAKKAREMVLRKNPLEVSTLPGKLYDCSSKDPFESEIYLVEGESAGGTTKNARDRKTQAVLPLKGKVLNVEKSGLAKALSNEEIRNMITAFGAGIGDEFNIDKLRYSKIIIMTDADVDGAHIATLLLTFFYRFMSELITNGNVYKANQPLYGIKRGKKIIYCYDEEDLREKTNGKDSFDIQRYKGLGEMNTDQLWETTMNKENRRLFQVTVEDAVEADRLFTMLMGDEVSDRREFIEKNALYVENLDI